MVVSRPIQGLATTMELIGHYSNRLTDGSLA
jgi:hypothetical protein